jgi:cytolysin-activating lysine-acyltransferase
MTQSSNGHTSDRQSRGAAAASGPGPFSKPAPEGAAKKVSEVLGEIVWLMSQSPLHKQFFISDLEWLVMTPVLLQQFRLFYDQGKPIGVAFWATVNAEVEERLAAGTSRLRPQDWKSGAALWVVEVIAPFGGAEEMVKDLKAKVFAGREMKFLAVGAKGREVL